MTNDAHANPAPDAGPLYDPNVATPTHAERARTLAEQISTGSLCTLAIEPEGYPYGSLVTFAFDAARPVFLISELAEHTRNLRRDGRASLLVAANTAQDPLANARLTLLGRAAPVSDPERDRLSAVYFARHPGAAYYASFKDFAFWALDVSALRYIGGYGRMSWLSAEEFATAEPDPIAPHARAIIAHMNEDHADAMPLYCRAFSLATDTSRAELTAIDRYGFEMSATTGQGQRLIRLGFPLPIASTSEARAALVALLKQARTKLGISPEPQHEKPAH
jgi:putative heme iron utilization protein